MASENEPIRIRSASNYGAELIPWTRYLHLSNTESLYANAGPSQLVWITVASSRAAFRQCIEDIRKIEEAWLPEGTWQSESASRAGYWWPIERAKQAPNYLMAESAFVFSEGLKDYRLTVHPADTTEPLKKALLVAGMSPGDAVDVQATISEEISEKSVSLESLLKKGSVIAAVFCLVSLFMWIVSDVPLLSPFMSILGIAMFPFVYWMGRKQSEHD